MYVRLGLFFTCLGLTIAGATIVARWSQPHVKSTEAGALEYRDQGILTTRPSIEKAAHYDRCLAGLNDWLEESRKRPELRDFESPVVRFAPYGTDQPVAESVAWDQPLARPQPGSAQIQLATYTVGDQPIVLTREDSVENRKEVYWPKPKQLVEQIEALQQIPQAKTWATEVLELLEKATQTTIDAPELGEILLQLESRTRQVQHIATDVWNSNSTDALIESSEVARIGYRLSRRLAVWQSVRKISTNSRQMGDETDTHKSVAYRRIAFEGLDSRWVDYLQLEDLRKAFESINPNRDEQKKIARKVLGRIYSPVLKPGQASFVRSVIDPVIIDFLKEQATDSVDVANLLTRIERYESSPSSFTGYYLNDQYQNLLWSLDPADQAAASELHTHYRNANFRLAVSERLLNRMIPSLPTTAMPVSETVKGARISGLSHVTNQVRVTLVPDPTQLMLSLETAGHVQSDTVARTKTFRILNQGEARFQVLKRLAIGRDGIDSSQLPVSSSTANQYVVGVESSFDNLPILSWMARKLVVKKLKEQAAETDRMFREKVESSAESRVQQEVETHLVKLRQWAHTNLFQSLMAMELEPEPLQMATTEHQLVMRYRLAGRDQMAANTARPRDTGTSLLSLQMHQSSFNNAFARIGLNGNDFTIEELTSHLNDVLGTEQIGSPDPAERQRKAKFGFAPFDPIRIDFEDSRIRITLNLRSLQIEKNGKTWRNLSLTVAYQVKTEGMQIILEQDDLGTRINGKRLRLSDKAAMSTLLKVVFKQQYSINALPEGIKERIGGLPLKVSQLVVFNGWLGISIDEGLPPIQQAESNALKRAGTVRRLKNRR